MHIKKISLLALSTFLVLVAFLTMSSNLGAENNFISTIKSVLADEGNLIYECEEDLECEWVSVNCCPENEGAEWKCINSADTILDCPEDIVCPQVVNPKPTSPCVCTDNQCVGDGEEDPTTPSEGKLIIDTFIVGNGDSGWFDSSLDNRTAICNNRAIQQVPPGHACPKIYDSCFLGTAGNGGDGEEGDDIGEEPATEENGENDENDGENDDQQVLSMIAQAPPAPATPPAQPQQPGPGQQPPAQQPGTQAGDGRVFACHISLAAEFLIDINYDIFLRNYDGTYLPDEDELTIDHEYFVHIEHWEEEDGEWIFTGSVFDTPIIEWREDTKADFDAQLPIADEFLTSFKVTARETLGLPFDNVWEEVLVGVAATIGGAKTAEVETSAACVAEKGEEGFTIRGVEEGICDLTIHIEGPHAYGTIDNMWFDEGNLPGYVYEKSFVVMKEPQ